MPDQATDEEILQMLEEARSQCGLGGLTTDPRKGEDKELHAALLRLEKSGRAESIHVRFKGDSGSDVDYWWWQAKGDVTVE